MVLINKTATFYATPPGGGGGTHPLGWATSGNGAPAWRDGVEATKTANRAPFATDTAALLDLSNGQVNNIDSYRHTRTPGSDITFVVGVHGSDTVLNMSNFDMIGPNGNAGGDASKPAKVFMAYQTGTWGYFGNLTNGRIFGWDCDPLLHLGNPFGTSTVSGVYFGPWVPYSGSGAHYDMIETPGRLFGDLVIDGCYFDMNSNPWPTGGSGGVSGVCKQRPDGGVDEASTKLIRYQNCIVDCTYTGSDLYLFSMTHGANFKPVNEFINCLLPASKLQNGMNQVFYPGSVISRLVNCYDLYTGQLLTYPGASPT